MNVLKGKKAFTIVELLVVIVVIGILATITIVSYSGISNRAKIASMDSDLSNSSKVLKMFFSENGVYPTSVTDCPNPSSSNVCLKSSGGAVYSGYSSTGSTFILTLTSNDGSTARQVTDSSAPAVASTRTGLLSSLSPSTIAAGSTPYDLVISPNGANVYVVNNISSGTVSMFSRNSSTGQLTALSPASIAAGTTPASIAITSDGQNVYVANTAVSGSISMYSRNASTGLLSALSPATISTGSRPDSIALSSDGNFVYAMNQSSNTISMFSRNSGTGLLTALSPATIATGSSPADMVISPDGKFVYVSNYNDSNVSMYSRNASTGLLTPLSPATISTNSTPNGMAMSSDGKFLYVSYTGYIALFSRDATTGLLSVISAAEVDFPGYPHDGVAISPDGTSLYVTLASNGSPDSYDFVYMYGRNPVTGRLVDLSPNYFTPNARPEGIIVSPDSAHVYVVNRTASLVTMYARN